MTTQIVVTILICAIAIIGIITKLTGTIKGDCTCGCGKKTKKTKINLLKNKDK